jgi:hypothetical protein
MPVNGCFILNKGSLDLNVAALKAVDVYVLNIFLP